MDCYKNKPGLTLVEMLAVIAVIVVLAGLVISVARRIDDQSKERATENVLSIVDAALQQYYDSEGAFPADLSQDPNSPPYCGDMYGQLQAVRDCREIIEKIDSRFYVAGPNTPQIRDAWGTVLDYRYRQNRDTFPQVWSAGPNKSFAPGKRDDDLTNQ